MDAPPGTGDVMPDLAERLGAVLPSELMQLVAPLLHTPPDDVATLRRHTDAYLDLLRESHRSGRYPDMDHDLGRACGDACTALLDALGDPPQAERNMLAHIAVWYFVMADDDEDDRDSLVGFDDDAIVVNACARLMGVAAAVIPLGPR